MRGWFVSTLKRTRCFMKVPSGIVAALSLALCFLAPIRTSAQVPSEAPASNPTPVEVPTTTTLMLISPEIPQGQALLATATITSTNPVSGSVQFFATNAGQLGYAGVSNGKAVTSLGFPYLGVYPIYAEYSGDSLNQGSKSAIVTATSTGTDSFGFSGTTATLVHSVPMTISVQ